MDLLGYEILNSYPRGLDSGGMPSRAEGTEKAESQHGRVKARKPEMATTHVAPRLSINMAAFRRGHD